MFGKCTVANCDDEAQIATEHGKIALCFRHAELVQGKIRELDRADMAIRHQYDRELLVFLATGEWPEEEVAP